MRLKQELHEALMDAFRSIKDLEMMLDYELDWKLNQMAGGNNYKEIVYSLIDKAEAQGQLRQLLEAAIAKNPLNPKLIKLKKSYLNPITEDEIKNLKSILEGRNFRTVKSSFLEILPEGAKEDNVELNEVKSTDDIINILCENYSNTSSNVPRIIKLVEHIVNNSDTDKSQKLVNWLNQVSSRLGIEISNVQSQPVESNYNLLFFVYPESKFFRIETAYTQNEITKTLDYLQDTNSSSVSVNNKQRKGILCSSFQEIPKVLDKIIKYFIEKHSAEDSLI
ncbi:effector-associated domain EAD1-containing protein [Scytonema sp. NUACC26]|uniref:effector-associated domain EAD1-containing protein n=1 Tax=Scytonema sp. NUACC26 TaxID=3140176 RepID=UPI0034DC420B